ncbi:hypothetical protein [Piscirickettsia litoralis]|uniref:Uncharacterized protein n=1 Tax=Piscirickettsia litoralis TaxID=1891921 RepID=A0ABX3A3P1_9GAMM|nr:hypothetical protein [Piscirickettsia litoralis]ODN42862.1 hypothetical protein BGC07_07920 [Piscirickettsia litoralis]
MKLAAIDELYESIQCNSEMSLSPEYASKLMQIAVAYSGQHVLNLSSQMKLALPEQKEIIGMLVKSVQESLENYVQQPSDKITTVRH